MACSFYFQANVKKTEAWLVTALLRGCEHIAFDRTIDVEQSLFEFFVPADMAPYFLEVMEYFEQKGLVYNLKQLPNRLC